MNISQAPKAGGACATHGIYDGMRCPKCARTHVLAELRQAVWEATQFLTYDEVEEYVSGVLEEVKGDEP